MNLQGILVTTICLILGLACPQYADATWSIVAVDPETGEVGLAAATCNPGIQFIASVVPGHGVVAAQAETSFRGRDLATELIAKGESAEEVLEQLESSSLYDGWFTAKFPTLQYGVATLASDPKAGSIGGKEILPWFGGKAGDTYSVQGNTLRGENVIAAAALAFEVQEVDKCQLNLSERLLRALEAGRDAGGDKRCPLEKPALSAILMVGPSVVTDTPGEDAADSLKIVTPHEISLLRAASYLAFPYEPPKDYIDPVLLLRKKFDATGRAACRLGT